MLEIENLTKTFGTQTVISDISMTLVSGKIYGLVDVIIRRTNHVLKNF